MTRLALRDFDAVLAVARRGSFRQAAIDLSMSTTALSHVIARIEAELGVRLFNRTTRSVALTDAGRVFVDRLGPSLQDVREAIEVVRARGETPSGTLRVNAPPFAARSPAFTNLLLEYARRYPDMHVDVVTEGQLRDIVAEGFDLGVRVASLVPTDMIALSLGETQRFGAVASPGYLAARSRPLVPTDLLNHDCVRVRLPDGAVYRWHFEKGGDTAQVEVTGPMTFDELALSRAAVLAGHGIGFFFEQDVIADIEDGTLVRLLEDWTPPFPGLCLYYPGRRHPSAGLAAFLALARELASNAGGPVRTTPDTAAARPITYSARP
jgi:DNA-binding transcriptional LysR family regulator